MSRVDLNSRPLLASYVRLKTDAVTGDPVLVFPEGVLVLNSTAHEILLLCDGRRSGRDIVQALGEQFEAEEATLRDDVLACLDDLARRRLLAPGS